MKCEKCNINLNHREIRAQQGSIISCPQCGQETKVKYSLVDSLTDPAIVPFGNLKYASRPISITWIVVFFAFFALLLILLIGTLAGKVTITG